MAQISSESLVALVTTGMAAGKLAGNPHVACVMCHESYLPVKVVTLRTNTACIGQSSGPRTMTGKLKVRLIEVRKNEG